MTATAEPERRCDAQIIVRWADGAGDVEQCPLPAEWVIPLGRGLLTMVACDQHKRTWVVNGGRIPRRIGTDR